jgi:hypothetical protein
MSPDNRLFGSDGSQLFAIDTSCAQSICTARPIGIPVAQAEDSINGLTFHPNGTLYAGTQAGKLLKVNPKTGAISTVHDFGTGTGYLTAQFNQGFGFEGGLAFGPNGGLYATVAPCPQCTTVGAASADSGVAVIMAPFKTAKVEVQDAGFVAMRGLVFVGGEEAGSSPVLLGTVQAQPPGSACGENGAIVTFDTPTSAPTLARCLSFQSTGATANPILPPLIASVTLRPKVHPGHRQVVIVRVSPDTVTRLVVVFPNGDTLTRRQIADTSGRATFSFVQPRSKIGRFSSRAQVTVSVGSGQNQSSEQYGYKVLFGSIDVVASPREVAAGSLVHLYVHTWPNRKVSIALLYPNSRLLKTSRKTGAVGWLSTQQRVLTGAVSGTRRTVAVVALLSKGPLWVSASTSFDIRVAGQATQRP